MANERSVAKVHGARLGLRSDRVELVSYDDRWPILYESEAALLRAALPGQIGSVEHIGSTAIVGMAAKPIIDLMVAVPSMRSPSHLCWSLRRFGYDLQADDPLPDRLFFIRNTNGVPTHHLSACEPTSEFWGAHLAFRDRLRADPEKAAQYLELKRRLSKRHSKNRAAYTTGKESFIRAVLRNL